MLLKSIRLKNIKTYVEEEISFSSGVNTIIGLNGSGKSTIIESIGYALFGYTKGKTQGLLRHNEKNGSISLDFVGNDSITYRVERTIKNKGQGTVSIYDIKSLDEPLFEGVSEVNSFIKRVLRIRNDQELEKLFSEVIAISQGTYVSAFLERPSVRKPNFDRLLGLDEYKKTSTDLLNLKNYITDNKTRPLEREIGELKGETNEYASNKENYLAKKEEIKDIYKEIDLKEKELEKINKTIESIAKKEEKIKELEKNIEKQRIELEAEEKLLAINEENYNKSLEAKDIVSLLEKDYLEYISNKKLIEEKEEEINDFSLIKEKISSLKQNIASLDAKSEVLRNQIQKDKEKEEEIKCAITNQEKYIEEGTKDLEIKKNEFEKNDISNKKKLEELNLSYKEKKEIKNIMLNSIDRLKDIKNKEYSSNDNEDELITLNKKIQEAKQEKEKLIEERASLYADEAKIEELKNLATDGLCPIFKAKCNNAIDKSIDDVLEDTIIASKSKLLDIEERIEKIDSLLLLETEVITKLASISNNKREKDDNSKRIDDIIVSLINQGVKLDKENILDSIEQNINELDISLNILEEDTLKESDKKEELIKQRSNIFNEEFKVNQAKVSLKDKKEELNRIALDIKDKEENIVLNTKKIEEYKESLKDLDKRKEEIEEIDNNILLLKDKNKKLEEKKDLYLSNLEKSKESDRFFENVEKSKNSINSKKEDIENMKMDIVMLSKDYDEQEAISIKRNKETLDKEVVSYKAIIAEKEKVLLELNDLILLQKEKLDLKEEKEKELESSKDACEFINRMRDVYSSLPEVLSEKYRKGISKIATSLYQLISKDNVHIDIEDDYNVLLVNNTNNNKTDIVALSGGEQMSVAIAVRLAMLKYLTNLDIYFLDEPTVNLDYERRKQVSEVVEEISNNLRQIYVISHDDTFDAISNNIIKVNKVDSISNIEK